MERLVVWMEENQEKLCGKQISWQKDVKEQQFPNNDHITVKKITDKVANMKRAWKDARAMQDRSGWGVRPEDNEESINNVLERKCAFFWRLEEIWGSQPNVTVIHSMDTMEKSEPETTTQTIKALEDSVQFNWSPTQEVIDPIDPMLVNTSSFNKVTQSSTQSSVQSEAITPARTVTINRPDIKGKDSNRSTPAPPRSSKKRDITSTIKQTLEERYEAQEEVLLKKHKVEMEVQRESNKEKIASEERIAEARIACEERITDRQATQSERIAQIQAESQAKMIKSQTKMMGNVLSILEHIRKTSAE